MFEFSVNKQSLITPLLTVAAAVDKKQSRPLLSNVLMRLSYNQIYFTATDLEIEICASVACESNSEDDVITVPAKKLVDIVRSLDDLPPIRIIYENSIVRIQQGRSSFKLTTLPADDYPASDDAENEIELNLARETLIHLLQSTQFAMSQQDVRVFLNALLLEVDGKTIIAVATDGHRMAICRHEGDDAHLHHRLLLPKKGVQEILRLLNNIEDNSVVVSAGKNHFKLISSQYIFRSKLIETRFPSYAKAIPKDQNKEMLIDRDALKKALGRIMILANEKFRAVLMHVQQNQLTLIASNQEQEEAVEVLEVKTQGDDIKIGINAGYLLDVLNFIAEGDVKISMKDDDNSILVEAKGNPQYQYIIMPMKI